MEVHPSGGPNEDLPFLSLILSTSRRHCEENNIVLGEDEGTIIMFKYQGYDVNDVNETYLTYSAKNLLTKVVPKVPRV